MPTAAALTSPPDAAADHLTALPAPTAPLRFHPLSFLDEGDGDVLIGRSDIDSYGVFPADGAALVKELQNGRSPADAAGWYLDRYGESVDMSEFIDTLVELELLRPPSVDDASSTPTVAQPVRWQRLGRAVFSPVGLVAYLALLAGAVVASMIDPRLIPAHQNVFFTDYLLLVELTVVVGQAPLILLHEGAHVLAGRRLGLRTRVRLGQRWYFLVFETVMDGLVSVPRRKRYLPILAGVLTDIGVIAALTLIAAATRSSGRRVLAARRDLPGAGLHHAAADRLAVLLLPADRRLLPDQHGARHRRSARCHPRAAAQSAESATWPAGADGAAGHLAPARSERRPLVRAR